ncbi:MAG TPA: hypothetical protein VIO11_04240 [Candidatus Methanoperedens sp.]
MNLIIRILKTKWLWSIISGFFLAAYAFWVPNLFSDNLPAMILVLAVTLIVGFALLSEGFLGAEGYVKTSNTLDLPLKKVWRFAGAISMFGYLLVYIPPEGRIVAHWWLDMITTVFAGLMIFIYGISDFLDFIKKTLKIQWLWSIFAGFYLLVYALWVPNLFSTNLPVMITALAITAVIGLGLLADGFFRACELDKGPAMPALPFKRLWRLGGAVLLAGFLLTYLPPYGQILAVAHWPLDLAITIVSGLAMLAYGIFDY